jgi:hypothetical protein
MKLYLFCSISLLILACQPSRHLSYTSAETAMLAEAKDPFAEPDEQIPNDHPIQAFISEFRSHQWEDLDAFYQHELYGYIKEPYFDHLRRTALYLLYMGYRLPEHADAMKLEYYANEVVALDYHHCSLIPVEALIAMRGYWDIERIRHTAYEEEQQYRAYIEAHFANPRLVLAYQGPILDRLGDMKYLADK